MFICVFCLDRLEKRDSKFPYKLNNKNRVDIFTLPLNIINYFLCYCWTSAYYLYNYNIGLIKLRNILDLISFIIIGISPYIVNYVHHTLSVIGCILTTRINRNKKWYFVVHFK